MALSGVHICFGGISQGGSIGPQTTLPSSALKSQTMASPATSTISAPNANGLVPLLSIWASAPIWYATGQAPDASGNAGYPRRYYDPTQQPGNVDIFVNAGDLFAWTFA